MYTDCLRKLEQPVFVGNFSVSDFCFALSSIVPNQVAIRGHRHNQGKKAEQAGPSVSLEELKLSYFH